MCLFAKNYKIVSSNLKPRVHLGRQASKNEINKSKPWSPIIKDLFHRCQRAAPLTAVVCVAGNAAPLTLLPDSLRCSEAMGAAQRRPAGTHRTLRPTGRIRHAPTACRTRSSRRPRTAASTPSKTNGGC
jgi:hypothetical protein